MMRSWKKWLWFLPLAVLALALSGFVIWAETPLGPMPEALDALRPDAGVRVETHPWLSFTPQEVQPAAGLVFYPGGRVDPRAYAPAARQIASQGFLVVIVPMPLNLAVFGSDRALEVIAAHPEVTAWAVGGHSLGGAMAAGFAHKHPGQVSGVIFWAAYPAASASLAGLGLPVLSVYGTQDGMASGGKIDASRPLLPADTRWVPIQGGNHAQFGWYGPQPGDNPATITRQAQQQQAVEATAGFLRDIGGGSQ
jgi:hypothetical protein